MATKKLTVHDRVLLSLARAAGGTRAPVPYEEVVLESWKQFPERFSLRKHPEFPDSNDQNKSLYGPLKKDGYVVSLGDMVFRLTDAGLGRVETLERLLSGQKPAASSGRLSRDQERLLRTAATSEAHAKWKSGRSDNIVDFDARAFFGVTVATPDNDRCRRVQAMQDAIASAECVRFPAAAELRVLSEFLIKQFPAVAGA